MSALKWCNRCLLYKSTEAYGVDNSRLDGLKYSCKVCESDRNKAYHHTEKRKLYLIEKRYGVKLDKLPDECQVCGAKEDICVDHNHTTQKYRGHLCRNCNSAIGQAGENAARLRALASYLENS